MAPGWFFLAMIARMLSAWAMACLNWASALSYSDFGMIFLDQSSLQPLQIDLRERRCGLRCTKLGLLRGSILLHQQIAGPGQAPRLERDLRTTLPVSSAVTVTPWTAWSDPTAMAGDSQVSLCATAVVTVSGGGDWRACAVIRSICRTLIPPRNATRIIRTTIEIMIFFFICLNRSSMGSTGF